MKSVVCLKHTVLTVNGAIALMLLFYLIFDLGYFFATGV